MNLNHYFSLKAYNTFSIEAVAKEFSVFNTPEELEELIIASGKHHFLVLGGGSNILLTKNYDGYVLKNEISGIDIVKEDEHHVYVKAGAGENWHSFVMFCIDRDLAGVENLSLIPGNVGASPMQNIGAYGVELKDVFHDLEAYHIKNKKIVTFTHSDCRFGYRESVFKNKYKDQYVILNVTFRLDKVPHYNTSYGAIEEELKRLGKGVSIQTISQAVINIRSSKLPDPVKIGNAGSFFKNPTIPEEKYAKVLPAFFAFCRKYYETVGYRTNMLCVGYRVLKDRESLLSYSWNGNMITIDPVSTANPGWPEFLTAYNEFCSNNGGVPLLNQTPLLTRAQVEKALGERWRTFGEARRAHDPGNRLLSSYFKDLLGE